MAEETLQEYKYRIAKSGGDALLAKRGKGYYKKIRQKRKKFGKIRKILGL